MITSEMAFTKIIQIFLKQYKKKQIQFSLLFTTYHGDEESNYRYIYSFFYFLFPSAG